jgi:hypothetical protein
MKKVYLILLSLLAAAMMPALVSAHSIPNAVLLLDVREKEVAGEVQIPLSGLGSALGLDLVSDSNSVVPERSEVIKAYLEDHIKPQSDGKDWVVTIGELSLREAEQASSGKYKELLAQLTMTPPEGASTRKFTLNYDVVMHQSDAHTALVSVRQDWASGIIKEAPVSIGTIGVNASDGKVAPLEVDLSSGSVLKGFVGMLKLGMSHIREGTDHVLFLLTLLLPAPLLVAGKRWHGHKGLKETLIAITKITAAFTIGPSLTLIIASTMRLSLPTQPIEALIAFSIIVSAVHALRPIFPEREVLIAGFFGLVHGMAFSFTLAELNLSTSQLVISLLGFNLGIEFMQLLIVLLVIIPLVIVAKSRAYVLIRWPTATVAIVAATGWLIDRIGYQNIVSDYANSINAYALWIVLGLYMAASIVCIRALVRKRYLPDSTSSFFK